MISERWGQGGRLVEEEEEGHALVGVLCDSFDGPFGGGVAPDGSCGSLRWS